MRPFWHPLSALFLADPVALATPTLLRLLLASEGAAELRYGGDRMWPSVRHGSRVRVRPMGRTSARVGEVVVACPRGVPDLFRVEAVVGGEARLSADADPEERLGVPESGVLARAEVARKGCGPWLRRARRIRLDLREALAEGPDAVEDLAETVRQKYDAQAPFYVRLEFEDIEAALLERIRDRVRTGGRLLVAGSGSGRECFALSRGGWRVHGVDFAPSMVELAREEASRRSVPVEFVLADLRSHREPAASLDAIVFTYDVYSFVPDRRDRVDLLRRMRGWLAPKGAVFLSARRVRSAYERLILALQLAARGGVGSPWGASHTRWLSGEGALRRSFVQVFTNRSIRAEVESAGFAVQDWRGGHGVLVPEGARARS